MQDDDKLFKTKISLGRQITRGRELANERGSSLWHALRALKSTPYGRLVAEAWTDFIQQDGVNDAIKDARAILGDLSDLKTVQANFYVSDDARIIIKPEDADAIKDRVSLAGVNVIEDHADIAEPPEKHGQDEIDVTTLKKMDSIGFALKPHGVDLSYEGMDHDKTPVYRLKPSDSIEYGFQSPIIVKEQDEAMKLMLEADYEPDALRDMIMHSIITGDVIILRVDEDKYTTALDCLWALDNETLRIALVTRAAYKLFMLDSVISVYKKLSSGDDEDHDCWDDFEAAYYDVEDKPNAGLVDDNENDLEDFDEIDDEDMNPGTVRKAFFNVLWGEMLNDAGVYLSINEEHMSPDGVADYRLISIQSSIDPDDFIGVDEDGEEVEVDPMIIHQIEHARRDYDESTAMFEMISHSVVTTAKIASGFHMNVFSKTPELETNEMSFRDLLNSYKSHLAQLNDDDSVDYLGRRINDGRFVFAHVDKTGKFITVTDEQTED